MVPYRFLLILLGVVLLVEAVVFVRQNRRVEPAPTAVITLVPTERATSFVSPSPMPSSTPTFTATPRSSYFYPLTRYAERKTVRIYGQKVGAGERQSMDCGDPFSGWHTGDDLESFANERNQEVPVYAITDGTVKQVQTAGGYGGLIVVTHTINGKTYTAYYGHVDISQAAVKSGDTVRGGQRLAYLGDHCSTETSNERKHLHFAIRRGTGNDIRGYVPDQSDLNAWPDPHEVLKQVNANEPEV